MSFPPGFLFGASTSAHQVEGNNVHNDWWQWEQRHPNVESSGQAADHWHRYQEDFALAKQLGHNAHRLSIEWSRIEPAPGKWNRAAVNHYREVLKELKRLNIKSFVTLHHFTNPIWLTHQGGWEHSQSQLAFARYVSYIAQHIGDLVDYWITVNEPMVYATQSFWHRRWPPQKRSVIAMIRVANNLAAAHRKVYRPLRHLTPHAPIGFAKHYIADMPTLNNWWFNHAFIQHLHHTYDFIGLNYYFPNNWETRKLSRSDLNWPIYPKGITQGILAYNRYRRPIYITENGLADAADSRRVNFIRDHLKAVQTAINQGVDVRGYLHWSLIDNFEWADGFTPRFGLIEIDYKTMKRTPRPSAYAYKKIIEQTIK